MITKQEMLPILVKACPSFAQKWDDHKLEYYDEEDFLPYIALGALGRHLVELYEQNATDEFAKIFAEVERLLTNGEDYVKEAAKIGFLESLQNNAEHAGLDPQVLVKYLGPASANGWTELQKFWAGEAKFIGN